jgi:hypothetical protein
MAGKDELKRAVCEAIDRKGVVSSYVDGPLLARCFAVF